jgi:hypothetical protein
MRRVVLQHTCGVCDDELRAGKSAKELLPSMTEKLEYDAKTGKVHGSGKSHDDAHHGHDGHDGHDGHEHEHGKHSSKKHEPTLTDKWVKWRGEKESMRHEMQREGEFKPAFSPDEITNFLGPEDFTQAHTKHRKHGHGGAHDGPGASTAPGTGSGSPRSEQPPVDKWLKFRNKRDSLRRKMEIEGISKDEIHAFMGSLGVKVDKDNAHLIADAHSHGKTAERPIFVKYRKMQTLGVSEAEIITAMHQDENITAADIDHFFEHDKLVRVSAVCATACQLRWFARLVTSNVCCNVICRRRLVAAGLA